MSSSMFSVLDKFPVVLNSMILFIVSEFTFGIGIIFSPHPSTHWERVLHLSTNSDSKFKNTPSHRRARTISSCV